MWHDVFKVWMSCKIKRNQNRQWLCNLLILFIYNYGIKPDSDNVNFLTLCSQRKSQTKNLWLQVPVATWVFCSKPGSNPLILNLETCKRLTDLSSDKMFLICCEWFDNFKGIQLNLARSSIMMKCILKTCSDTKENHDMKCYSVVYLLKFTIASHRLCLMRKNVHNHPSNEMHKFSCNCFVSFCLLVRQIF